MVLQYRGYNIYDLILPEVSSQSSNEVMCSPPGSNSKYFLLLGHAFKVTLESELPAVYTVLDRSV